MDNKQLSFIVGTTLLCKGRIYINTYLPQLFVCFAAEDRYKIAEPIVYHLKNYGIMTWYDRHALLMGDNRIEKNLGEGASKCKYILAILSKNTANSVCAMEELSIIKKRYSQGKVTIFPVLYELSPEEIPYNLEWIKSFIFKEVDRRSGTREICNHIACKITEDIVTNCNYKNIQDIVSKHPHQLPPASHAILSSYQTIDCANLNSRVALLYALYLTIIYSDFMQTNATTSIVSKIFERLLSETRLNLDVDYRDLWLLENATCILVDNYITFCTESKM